MAAAPPFATPDYASACTRVGDFDVTYLVAGPEVSSSPEGRSLREPPETVILLHGFGAWAEVVWRRAIPALATRYRVIAPDLIGFGLSSKPGRVFFEAGDPVTSEARFLAAFMDTLGVERATLVGSSFGGGVALRLATLAPERVDRLVLVGAMGLGRSIHYAYKALAMPVIGAHLATPDRGRLRRMWRALVADPSLVTEDVIERNFELLSEPGAAEVLLAARVGVNALGQKLRLLDLCEDVTQPTLVVWGAKDGVFPVRHARRAARAIPGARLVVLPRVGHIPPFEAPEAFNAALLRFLARAPSGRASPRASGVVASLRARLPGWARARSAP